MAVVVALAFRFGEAELFRSLALGVALALMAVPAVQFVQARTSRQAVRFPDPAASVARSGPDAPDVYFIVLDAYGRQDVLEHVYGFENSPFIRELQRMGFTIPSAATANYPRSHIAVASMLAMDYNAVPERIVDVSRRVAMHELMRGNNAVVRLSQAAGYEYIHIESGWNGTRCGTEPDVCVRAPFVDDSVWAYLEQTPISSLLKRSIGHPLISGAPASFDALERIAASPSRSNRPRLVFSHVLPPILPCCSTVRAPSCRGREATWCSMSRTRTRRSAGADKHTTSNRSDARTITSSRSST